MQYIQQRKRTILKQAIYHNNVMMQIIALAFLVGLIIGSSI